MFLEEKGFSPARGFSGSRKRARLFQGGRPGAGRRRLRGRGPRFRRRNQRTAGFLGIELKFYDTFLVDKALQADADAAAGEVNPSATVALNTVIQGDGESNRDGRNMIMKKISVRGVIEVLADANATAHKTAPNYFIALVHDKQTNGALLNSEDVYVNNANNSVTATSLFRNLQHIQRFNILGSVQLVGPMPDAVCDGTNIEIAGYTLPFEIHKDLNIKVNFDGTTEDIANITDNSLTLLAWTTNTLQAPTISYQARLRFVG